MVLKKISQYIPGLSQQPSDAEPLSVRVEAEVEKAYTANLQNPFLISFPRTGSHWLRMLCELYFERPTLVRLCVRLAARPVSTRVRRKASRRAGWPLRDLPDSARHRRRAR